MKKSTFSGLHNFYEWSYSKASSGKVYIKRDIKRFGRELVNTGLILDIGCGGSPYKDDIKHVGYYSLDLTPQANTDVQGDICFLPFKDNSCDLIICTEVLEHVYDYRLALRELRRILKDDGNLIITTPFLYGVHANVDLFRWTEMGLRMVLEESGFEIINMAKRGGIFSCLSEGIKKFPGESLTISHSFYKDLPKYFFPFIMLLLLIPLSRLLILLDRLDIRKEQTLGYNVLAKKIITLK